MFTLKLQRWCSASVLVMASALGGLAHAELVAVPTFECVGLYWSPQGGGDKIAAKVEYRVQGQPQWQRGQDLWYDGRAQGGRPAEYRGSLVNLKPGETYDVRTTLASGFSQTQQVHTWSDAPPIARTIEVPATSAAPLIIKDAHGSKDGYILYTAAPGREGVIDVSNAADACVQVSNSSYIILRGLTLRGARKHGIQLGTDSTSNDGGNGDDVHDIIVEKNDISDWGTAGENGFGGNMQSAVYSNSLKLQRIVVQRNRMHNPRTTANCWKEKNRTFHPEGPQGVSFMRGQGQYVIRYNEITGDPTHHFNDSMGAFRNFSYDGFPNRDSDIYGNYIAYCWDDAIESEGANMNVRIWGNYLTETYHGIATASVSMGPLYIFRNVACISRTGPQHRYGQSFMKVGGNNGKDQYYGDGRVYLFNNTMLQLPGSKEPQIKGGIGEGNRTMRNYITRNNILATSEPASTYSIQLRETSDTNSFDYDLYNGRIPSGAEAHGIAGEPKYTAQVGFDLKTMTGAFCLDPSSPGFDKGVVLDNFTSGYTGAAPDVGAHEAGTPPMQFGPTAGLAK